ncbi:hypothetical protein FD755_002433 [Muntiacus reevesi]|uniref:COMM domain-containing protein n=1 Tax=Muntiacus reevesi TaxID=9886 RepID=A0A5J5N419_MUNRE|nr:hypothetical protein FD755_002433 [Muntiacus reevesi]
MAQSCPILCDPMNRSTPGLPVHHQLPDMKKAVSLINEIDIGRFPRLLTRILQKLHLKAESSFSEEEEEKLQVAFSLEKQDLHLVLETISFILEQAVYHNVKPATLQQQLENIHLRQDKAEAFASAWSSMGQETIEKFRQRILAPQKARILVCVRIPPLGDLPDPGIKPASLKSPHLCILGINLTWFWYIILIVYCCICFTNVLVKIYVHAGYWSVVSL